MTKKKKIWIWRIRIRINGKQHEKTGRHKNRKIAFEKCHEDYLELLRKKENIDSGINFEQKNMELKEFMEEWFVTYRVPELKPQTINNRRGFMEDYIYPRIGHIPLKNLNRLNYQKFINSLSPNLSFGSIKILNSIVRSCLEFACYDLRIIEYNPAEKIRIPNKPSPAEKKQDELNKFYTEKQISSLLACEDVDILYKQLIFCLVETGLRLGEITGLLESSYIEKEKALLINVQLLAKTTRTNPILAPPKTEESERLVYLDEETNLLIKKRILQNKKKQTRIS
ncbi:site-specific integrase [Listeria fleischmannii]|uniref:Tyrosine recombinase XerC n=1 Tax=Listeria fleischmannii FSL S10-1203 TaxID=1265822 RepID=W7DQ31_9LIST|nr:site-specific integrase [Listeria fleischmannii]EUJ59188.1 tyrosine recombinase XerC [Listeria fleischmannii FSL S10-1203]